MARRPDPSERLERLEQLLATTRASLPALRAALHAKLATMRAAEPHERGLILDELATNRSYRADGHRTFGAFLASEGISRTTAHRLRTASRLRSAEEVAQWGANESYLRARDSIAAGQTIDAAAIARRASGWLRRAGFRLPRVTIVPHGRRFLVRMEVDVREMSRVLSRAPRRR